MKYIKHLACFLSVIIVFTSINIGTATDSTIYMEDINSENTLDSNIYFENLEDTENLISEDEYISNEIVEEVMSNEIIQKNSYIQELNSFSDSELMIQTFSNTGTNYLYSACYNYMEDSDNTSHKYFKYCGTGCSDKSGSDVYIKGEQTQKQDKTSKGYQGWYKGAFCVSCTQAKSIKSMGSRNVFILDGTANLTVVAYGSSCNGITGGTKITIMDSSGTVVKTVTQKQPSNVSGGSGIKQTSNTITLPAGIYNATFESTLSGSCNGGAAIWLGGYISFTNPEKPYMYTYTIDFNANGGSGKIPTPITKEGADSSVVMGDINSSVPTKNGYIFKGWSATSTYNSDNKRIAYTAGSTGATTTNSSWSYDTYCINTGGNSSNKTLTLYAQWEPVYSHTLAYNANGGSNIPSNSTVTNSSSTYNMTVSNSIPTRIGYTFTGWNTNSNGTGTNYSAGNSVSVGANATVTLYAKWSVNSSTLKVNPNSGTWNGSNLTQSFTQNYNTIKNIPIPTRTGHTFTEWTRTNTYGSLSSTTSNATYTFSSINNVTDTITAQWRVNNYTVTYIDKIEGTNIQLGSSTESKPYGSIIRGADKGNNTSDNTYYNKYHYVSDTSATVTTSGATVYRYFRERMTNISGNIIWEDWNNKNSSRPSNVTLYIMSSNGNKYTYTITGNNSKNTSINKWAYSKTLPLYDDSGNVITYTVSQDRAISLEEGLFYKEPLVNKYDITNKITNTPVVDTDKYPIDVTVSVVWNDNNDKYGFRPENAVIQLLRNETPIKTASVSSNYIFKDLLKYDENGNKYTYTIKASDEKRYAKTENNSNTYNKSVTYTLLESNFSVTIPKKITLNGNTGKANYTVSVNGTFYYNDTLTVKPNNSFTLTDRSNISSMQANVTQVKTDFIKEDLPSSINGSISVNRDYFAGLWKGYFNFEIKFTMGN